MDGKSSILFLPTEFFDNTFGVSMIMAALAASLYTALYQEKKSARLQDFKDLNSPVEFAASQAAICLLHFSRNLFNGMCSKYVDFRQIVEFLQTKVLKLETQKTIQCECQVSVFSSDTGTIIERHPHIYNDSCRQLWLFGHMCEGKVSVTGIILNIAKFSVSKTYGTFCFYCDKYFSGKGSKHRCRKRRSCFACHRPVLKPSTYTNASNIGMFCSSEMEPKVREICKKCHLTLYNPKCKTIHVQKVCRWGWYCLKCNQYTFRSKYFKTCKTIRQMHTCLMIFCTFCGKKYPITDKKSHLCSLFKLKPSQTFPKLAFLQMTFRGSNAAWCADCKATPPSCEFCANNIKDEKPNIAVLLWEEERGYFNSYTFADYDFCDYVSIQKNELIYKTNFGCKEKVSNFRGFCHSKKVKVNQTMFAKEESVIGQILNFILNKKFADTTIIINCSESNEPYFFIAELLKKGLVPQVLKNDNRILLVECEQIGLRIIDSQNYIPITFNDLRENSEEEIVFFPRKWNKQSQYTYVGNIPCITDFFFFDDTPAQVSQKKAYVSHFQGQWCLKDKLIEHTKQKVQLNAKSMLSFISSTFEMQSKLFAEFSKPSTFFLHPINRPLVTFSSFAYNLFLMISNSDLRMVKGPIEYNSSKGEVEFAQFLEHIFSRNLEHAWSPYGQTKEFLPISIPDILDKRKKTLYYYNGCYVHMHCHEKCLFRGKKQQKSGSKLFYDKMKQLSVHSDVKKIKIIWQCGWVKEKRENPIVRDFMKNIYKNPPCYRLNPRSAGKCLF